MKLIATLALIAAGLAVGTIGRADDAARQKEPAPTTTASVDQTGPKELIEQSAQKMLRELDANRAAYRKDPKKINKLVDEVLLPHFDTEYAAQRVLGKYWRDATPQQRQRFIKAFYQSLLENYGSALLEFTGDKLVVLPFRGDDSSANAVVRTEVKTSDGKRVPVNYSMRKTPQGWKAWDVTIEGISYVKNFRTDFGSEIDQKGLEAVIQRLEKEGPQVLQEKAAERQT
jgi:phospholipid transport system substrate-binding protein